MSRRAHSLAVLAHLLQAGGVGGVATDHDAGAVDAVKQVLRTRSYESVHRTASIPGLTEHRPGVIPLSAPTQDDFRRTQQTGRRAARRHKGAGEARAGDHLEADGAVVVHRLLDALVLVL